MSMSQNYGFYDEVLDKFGEEIASATVNTYQGDKIEELVESE